MRATFILILTLGLIPLSVSAGPKSSSKPPPKPASPVPEDRWMWLPGGAFTFGCEPRSACERARKKRGVRAKVDGFWSTKKNPGYEATRGGLPDLEPVYPSDYGDALRGHHSEELGFRCVQSTKPPSKSG